MNTRMTADMWGWAERTGHRVRTWLARRPLPCCRCGATIPPGDYERWRCLDHHAALLAAQSIIGMSSSREPTSRERDDRAALDAWNKAARGA